MKDDDVNIIDKTINDKIDFYYKKCRNLPATTPIVRDTQKDDAFEVVVLEALYKNDLLLEENIDFNNLSNDDICELAKYIVPAHDDGIDIVKVISGDEDESNIEFVQVKNSVLDPNGIREALDKMKSTIQAYLKAPSTCKKNLINILNEIELDETSNCKYIVVHRGDKTKIQKQNNDEQIISGKELFATLNIKNDKLLCVPRHTFELNKEINISEYTNKSDDSSAYITSLCGFDLAKLSREWNNSKLGRNILYGHNYRDSLNKSQTYEGMKTTITKEPAKFWFYNNGITILAEEIVKQNNTNNITLKNFSIINGAQTTSALARIWEESANKKSIEEKLKKVFVLTKILKVSDKEFQDSIALYNNTQNSITSRDLVSRNPEQRELKRRLENTDGKEHIYVEITRGSRRPLNIVFRKHQITTNEALAQYAFAGLLKEPFNAKNMKKTLFSISNNLDEGKIVNNYYTSIFHESDGILFKKTFEDIDELLFIKDIIKEAKNDYIRKQKEEDEPDNIKIAMANIDVCSKAFFLFLAYYYILRGNAQKNPYNYDILYNKKERKDRNELVQKIIETVIVPSVIIIKGLVHKSNKDSATWIRNKNSYKDFLDIAEDQIVTEVTGKAKMKEIDQKFREKEKN